jgi:hypothetical protein
MDGYAFAVATFLAFPGLLGLLLGLRLGSAGAKPTKPARARPRAPIHSHPRPIREFGF